MIWFLTILSRFSDAAFLFGNNTDFGFNECTINPSIGADPDAEATMGCYWISLTSFIGSRIALFGSLFDISIPYHSFEWI